jgi:signal transduction histidine kinase/HPt (histidine-containing phosphotransfer) domain-containing protein/ActR/RegA family two-component response regulator
MIVVILLGLVAAVFVYRVGEQSENNRVQVSFERVAGERIAAVEAGLLTTISSLQPLASFFTTQQDPTAEKFHRFVTPLLSSFPGLQAFNWAPLVENADRARLEAEVDHVRPGFRIRELSARGMVIAAERARYYPVTMTEPLRGNEKVVGYDLASEPVRRVALEAAIDTGAPQATGRITLVQEPGDQFSFLVFYPVSDDSGRLSGLVVGVFRMGDVVNRLGRVDGDADLTLTIRDLAAAPQDAIMYPAKQGAASLRPVGVIATSRTLQIGGRPWRVEAVATPEFLRREGGWLPQVLLVAWLFLAGNIVWLVDRRYAVEAEVRDRTADMRQARDEARAANRAKGDFLATMSHEIRTPLNGVVALADHLLEQEMPPEQRDSLKIIARSGDHLLRVINDILDFSKLEAKKFDLEIRPFVPEHNLRNAVALLTQQATDKGLALDVQILGSLPEKVEGDSARMRQILLNIISNAIKFTEAGGVDVEVSAEPPDDRGRHFLSFTIRDTGPGMSEDTRAQLFTEFWQADNSIARRFGGTGLGLAISRRLVERMNGTISVVSAPGRGSAFTIRVPFKGVTDEIEQIAEPETVPEPEPSGSPTPGAESEPRHDFSGRTILLAEDNPTNRAIAKTILARTGARIVEAHDGVEALTAASGQVFDLILMDVHMPNMTGLVAARAIRALPAPYGRTPIVALTASAFQEDRDQCRAAGMTDFLAKPYRGGPLRDMAAKAMNATAPPPRRSPRIGSPDAPHHDEPAFEFESFALLGAEVGAEDARVLLREFMHHAQARLDIIEADLGGGGLRAIGQEAHALKSSAAMMGLARLAVIARELEAAAKRDDSGGADSLRSAARAAFDDARPYVAEILSAA